MTAMNTSGLAICIPTFKRADLLAVLLSDLSAQGMKPDLLIVVDGDPCSGDVLKALKGHAAKDAKGFGPTLYVPSNHKNLPYQRLLGWELARRGQAGVLVYLDDDLRILDASAIARLVAPLNELQEQVVACTGSILYPQDRDEREGFVPGESLRSGSRTSLVIRLFGSSRCLRPGSLSPSGHRIPPGPTPSGTADLEWLRGGVMAIRMEFLSKDCFSDDLFALAESGHGHGEDTLLSRRLASKGRLLFVSNAQFLHPCVDKPKAYATRARDMGFGTAYSRRLLNDNYRWPSAPSFGDRIALCKSYAGTATMQFLRVIRNPNHQRLAFACGYCNGAWKGLTRPPKASRLTPSVNWHKDAQEALSAAKTLSL
jgi:glycosyltransferase involved in cell wall biosynthesis